MLFIGCSFGWYFNLFFGRVLKSPSVENVQSFYLSISWSHLMLPLEILITNEYGCTCTTVTGWSSCCTVSSTRVVLFLLPDSYHVQRTSTTRRRCAIPGVNIVSQYWLVPHGPSSPRWPLIIEADVFTCFHDWWSTIRVIFDEHRPSSSQYEELEQQTPYFRSLWGWDLYYGSLARRAICGGCYCCSIGSISHEHRVFHLCNLQFFDLRIAPQEHTLVGHSLTEGLLSLAYLRQRSSASWGNFAVLQDSGSWVTCSGNCNLPLYIVSLSLIPCCAALLIVSEIDPFYIPPPIYYSGYDPSTFHSFKLLSSQDTVQLNCLNCARQPQPLVIVISWEAGPGSKRVCLPHTGGHRPRGWHELSLEVVASSVVRWRLDPRPTQVERMQLAWPKLKQWQEVGWTWIPVITRIFSLVQLADVHS